MTDATSQENQNVKTDEKPRGRRRIWSNSRKSRQPRLPRKSRADRKPGSPRKPRAQKPSERVEREWRYSETRDAGGFFPSFSQGKRPRKALGILHGILYWIRVILTLALVLVLLAVIVWAIGELRIYGYGPADVWTAHAVHFAHWINSHLGGGK